MAHSQKELVVSPQIESLEVTIPSSRTDNNIGTENKVSEQEPNLEKLKRGPGFQNPEVRERAMKNSQATRARLQEGNLTHLSVDSVASYAEDGSFTPTKDMVRVLAVALNIDSGNKIKSWFQTIGLHRNTWYAWQKIEGFPEWWNRAYMKGLETYSSEWIKIGIKKMHKDVKYWLAMGKLAFGFIEKVAVKTEKTPDEQVITNQILQIIIGNGKLQDLQGVSKTITLSPEDVKELNENFIEEEKEGNEK